MIHRDAELADGSLVWVVISQVDHAQLAGELAEGWASDDVLREHRSVIVPTIRRHDDGWREWERAPTILPPHGFPRTFFEMPTGEALDIRRKSIDGVADLGPLAQFMVAEHFCRLRRAAGDNDDPKARDFLAEFAERSPRWLAQWQAESPTRSTADAAERAVEWLQFFDLFSLWLCMAERVKTQAFNLPGGGSLEIRPIAATENIAGIVVRPWPWNSPCRELSVAGRQLASRRFTDDAALRSALAAAPQVWLKWTLTAC